MDIKKAFNMPKPMKITGRTSTITNSFVSSIIPFIPPSEVEIKESLDILGLSHEDLRCAYCGDKSTEWDHLRPLVENQKPTGYISEINNLVPACGKCNQSKGNKHWKVWISSPAKLSPKTKGVIDLNDRIKRLEDFERIRKPKKLDILDIVGKEDWNKHWNNCGKLHSMMKESQDHAEQVKEKIEKAIKQN